MFSIQKDETSSPSNISLNGVIDEQADFSPLDEGNPKSLHVDCEKVSRINSIGIKLWRKYFSNFRKAGGKVCFYKVSPALVSTSNYLHGFIAKEEVHSICVPYACDPCDKGLYIVCSLSTLEASSFEPEAPICGQCGGPTEIDEIPTEYFSFLKK